MSLPPHLIQQLIADTSLRATTSGGKGGQNVNKVATRVELFFDVRNSPLLSEDQKQLITLKLKHRISNDGVLRITSSESRTQWENRERVKAKFLDLLEKAFKVNPARSKTKPSAASKQERLRKKKLLGEKKRTRKGVGDIESND